MSKPKSMPVPDQDSNSGNKDRREHNSAQQEPLSGSKKTKQKNHVDHHNPQG